MTMSFEAFLKIDGIPGESSDDKHKNEIDVLSFSFGISRQNERGRPSIADFSIVKTVDTSSPLLFDAACQGDTVKSALFTARKAGKGQQEFLIITMEQVLISSVQHSGAPGTDGVPMESVSLDFQSLEMEVFKQNPDGSMGSSTKTLCSSRRGGLKEER
jgi:type VI secretion system secreted protein Hcp